jgi:hypothetical protein
MGKRPHPSDYIEDDTRVHPREKPATWRDLFGRGLSALKAIGRKCLDCSGGNQAEVRACKHTGCELWAYRCGRNPNRSGIGGFAPKPSPEHQR